MEEAFKTEDAISRMPLCCCCAKVTQIANETGLHASSLSPFSANGNSTLKTTIAVMKALIELTAKPHVQEDFVAHR